MGFSCDYVSVSDVWSETFVVARKTHTCYECNYKIPKGEKYVNIKSLYEGVWGTFHICERCHDLIEAGRGQGMRYLLGELFEDYEYYLDKMPAKLDENGDPYSGWELADKIKTKHCTWKPEN